MTVARETTNRRTTATPVAAVEGIPLDSEPDAVVAVEPESEPEPVCAFPLEVRQGRCPVAVFNSPRSPNERIAYAKGHVKPLKFLRGLLAVFEQREADIVRGSNPGGSTYIEANPRVADEPFICKTCYPPTRWYSQQAYDQHTTFAHVD